MTPASVARPGPLAQLRAPHLPRRLAQLIIGLTLYGVSMGLIIDSGLGMMPWDVLHYGIARHTPLSVGQVVIATGLLVLLLWIPIREMPGLGTVANALWIGVVLDAWLAHAPSPHALGWRVLALVAGVVLNGVATAMYIGSALGAGPRDGLMTGLHRLTGWSIRTVRTAIEVVVVVLGVALGGVFGLGTVLYALAIGPLTQLFMPVFATRR